MNIIVTGASRGIGFQIVKEFCKIKDANIFAVARSLELLNQLKEDCAKEFEREIKVFDCDVSTDLENTEFAAAMKNLSSVDILINNAGNLINKPFLDLTTDDWQDIYKVNVFGVARFVKFLYPQLKAGKQAHIVNIGSMGGVERSSKFPGLSAYSSSKAALANLTECLAEEFKEDGISCNCLCLGAVNTQMLRAAFPGYEANVEVAEIAKFISDFAVNSGKLFNGKIIPVSSSTP